MATYTSEELNAIAQAPMSSIDPQSDAPHDRIPSPTQAYSTSSAKFSPKPSKPKHAAIKQDNFPSTSKADAVKPVADGSPAYVVISSAYLNNWSVRVACRRHSGNYLNKQASNFSFIKSKFLNP